MVHQSDEQEVIAALAQLPFPVGSTALIALLRGDPTHDTVRRHRLDRHARFGALGGYSDDEIKTLIFRLRTRGVLEQRRLPGTSAHVLSVATRAVPHAPALPTIAASPLTQNERGLLSACSFFLEDCTEEQRHAIVAQGARIRCIAGAGSGKTAVLVRRIEFLQRFCGVSPERILAITFTRKARKELQRRLDGRVAVETFNGLAEKLLVRHGHRIYDRPVRMVTYQDKIRVLYHAARVCGLDLPSIVQASFSSRQQRDKTREQLTGLFLQDCFAILDATLNQERALEEIRPTTIEAKRIHALCTAMRDELRALGLRTYADQLADAVMLLRHHTDASPGFTHILVDEYQDVNPVQRSLLALLAPAQLFVVGDPRQSIYGWRGSDLGELLAFPADATIVLTSNHRSSSSIVQAGNIVIRELGLPPLASTRDGGTVELHTFAAERDELEFLRATIAASAVPREEIFVLTRTNRQLQDVATHLAAAGIACIERGDEQTAAEITPGNVTLSTIHAIKGLEAHTVFLPFCTAQNYPCRASDHPVLDLIRATSYDRDAEELRLFYVGLTRAKHALYFSHTGAPSVFLSSDLKSAIAVRKSSPISRERATIHALRDWRTRTSRTRGVPPFLLASDTAIAALVRANPRTLQDLARVAGISSDALARHGGELLAILHGVP